MRYDVIIVGGGPAAGYTAWKISESGFAVLILEEHKKIGLPVQCAGLVTTKLIDIIDINDCILNTVYGAHIFSPKEHRLILDSGKPKAHVIDRTKFDQKLISSAVEAGAELRLKSRVRSLRYKHEQQKSMVEVEFKSDDELKAATGNLIIGADGANSIVRKTFSLPQHKLSLRGMGMEFEKKDIPSDFVQIFSGNQLAPGFFAWVIPAGDRVRIGLCIAENTNNVVEYFDRFFKLCIKKGLAPDAKPVQSITGKIPLGALERTTVDNVMLVGDAAAQVKPTSGGGIYPGLKAASECAKAAVSALEVENYSNDMLESYHQSWRKLIGQGLDKGLRLHKAFMHLSDDKIEEAFNILDKPDILEVISKKGDIESPFQLAKLIFKKAPKLIKFAGPYFKTVFH